jgi:pimeloyl-ACP methyl ester carboxylesterase
MHLSRPIGSRRLIPAFALTLALSATAVVPALAVATSPAAAPPAPTVGTLTVVRHAGKGRPVILIPGLGSGPWAWGDTPDVLARDHVVYVVTLAGFDGTRAPTGAGSYLEQAQQSLVRLIEQQHLHKPVLVGHSLGGTLALKLATEQPHLLGAVVAVDGLPVMPMTENLPPVQRRGVARTMQARIAGASPAQFKAQQLAYMQSIGTIDAAQAPRYAAMSARSDPKAVARYMAEDLALDFRARMKNATLPILEISAYYAADATAGPQRYTESQKRAYWKSLLGDAPDATVVSISPSRHFVMLDQAVKFQRALRDFIDKL